MTADYTWMELMRGVPRALLIGIEGQILCLCVCSMMLPARGSRVKLAVFGALKVLFLLLVDSYTTVYMKNSSVVPFLRFMLHTTANGLLTLLFCRTFYGGYARVMLAIIVSEMMVSILQCSGAIFANYLEDREKLFVFDGELQWMDLLMFGGVAALGGLLLRLASPFLKKFRAYRLRHPALIVSVYLIYILAQQIMSLFSHLDDHWFMITTHLLQLSTDLVGMLLLFLIIQRYGQKTRMEQQFLAAQLQLIETQYGSVRKQMRQMETCREIMERQMQEITQRKVLEPGRARAYLESLQAEYDTMRAGMYCNSWIVDAVICCHMREAHAKSVKTECIVQANCTESYDENILARVLLLLFHCGFLLADERRQYISLHIAEMLGKLRIEFSTDHKMRNYTERQIRRYVKNYGGKITVEAGEGGSTYLISLPKKGSTIVHSF